MQLRKDIIVSILCFLSLGVQVDMSNFLTLLVSVSILHPDRPVNSARLMLAQLQRPQPGLVNILALSQLMLLGKLLPSLKWPTDGNVI